MLKFCPRCARLVFTTEYKYYDGKNNLIRTEVVCNQCKITIEVKHYIPKEVK